MSEEEKPDTTKYFKKVKELPKAKQLKTSIFDDMLEAINSSSPGYYEIDYKAIPNIRKPNETRTLKSTYPSLAKRITERFPLLKIRTRGEQLFIERLKEKPKTK